MSDLRTIYEKARGEVAAMFNHKLAELTPEQALRVDTATALRLALDDLQTVGFGISLLHGARMDIRIPFHSRRWRSSSLMISAVSA